MLQGSPNWNVSLKLKSIFKNYKIFLRYPRSHNSGTCLKKIKFKNVLTPKWKNKSTGAIKSKQNQVWVCKAQGQISETHHLLSSKELAPAHSLCGPTCHHSTAAVVLVCNPVVLTSPKCWGLHCNWVAHSPVAYPDRSSKTLTLPQGTMPQLLSMTPVVLKILLAFEVAHLPMVFSNPSQCQILSILHDTLMS